MRPTDMTRRPGPYTTVAHGAATGAVRADARATGFGRRPVWGLLDVIFAMLERRKQRRALMGLDDHLLKDIGVSRGEVEQEVSKPFWRG